MIDRETILCFLMLHFAEFAAWCESESVAQAIVERLKMPEIQLDHHS